MKKKDKFSVNLGQALADNLSRNVSLSHIKDVERGFKPANEDYYFIKKNIKYFQTLEKFRKWKYSKGVKKS